MKKKDTKLRIIKEGARLVHARGFNNTGIQEILDAAGVPKGSFYFYFKSKEDFGLHLIDYFGEILVKNAMEILQDKSIPPLERLNSTLERNQQRFERIQFKYGCPIGNMMQEMADISDAFRERTALMYVRLCSCYEECLRDGQQSGDISLELDPKEMAEFIVNSWEGAIMHMKLTKDVRPLDVCRKLINAGVKSRIISENIRNH